MLARISVYRGSPDRIDEAIRYGQEQILPRLEQMEGFEEAYFLVDRLSGKALSITLWESEEAMRASEEAASQLRSESAEAAGETVESVERYEVVMSPERSRPGGEPSRAGRSELEQEAKELIDRAEDSLRRDQ